MKKILLLMIITIFVNAEYCSSGSCISKIEKIYTQINGNVLVSTNQDEKLTNCTPVSGVYFTLNTSLKNADMVYSTLLSASMLNKTVNIRIVENTANCLISYVILDSKLDL